MFKSGLLIFWTASFYARCESPWKNFLDWASKILMRYSLNEFSFSQQSDLWWLGQVSWSQLPMTRVADGRGGCWGHAKELSYSDAGTGVGIVSLGCTFCHTLSLSLCPVTLCVTLCHAQFYIQCPRFYISVRKCQQTICTNYLIVYLYLKRLRESRKKELQITIDECNLAICSLKMWFWPSIYFHQIFLKGYIFIKCVEEHIFWWWWIKPATHSLQMILIYSDKFLVLLHCCNTPDDGICVDICLYICK